MQTLPLWCFWVDNQKRKVVLSDENEQGERTTAYLLVLFLFFNFLL